MLGAFRRTSLRLYNFASTGYTSAIANRAAASVDSEKLRKDALAWMEHLDAEREIWHSDFVCTNVNGVPNKSDGKEHFTLNAFDKPNGVILNASPATIDGVINHILSFKPAYVDLRQLCRDIEDELISEHGGTLIGNQAADFFKQDGVTEIEEWAEACLVERQLNDQLLAAEERREVNISRDAAFVGCVSNFSNFLDLSRKTLRNLEIGVPCVILSRSNTTQHCYRWFQLLASLLSERSVDPGMLTFVACSIEEQRRIMSSCNHHPLYLTGSRPVAEAIKGLMPATFSSTGGPNTMVVTDPSKEEVQQAIRWSTLIENSGQCTALRHVVMPAASSDTVESIFRSDQMLEVEEPKDSLEKAEFAGQFREWGGTFPEVSGYTRLGNGEPVAFRVNEDEAFPYGIDEQWRRAFIDVTTPGASEDLKSTAFLDKLATWLKTEQPITLSVNGDDPEEGYPIMSSLFERTAQVVYTVGNNGAPSLSCQARPQDGEIFGEFPPRKDLSRFTKTPVVVPSSTPSYNSTYNAEYLKNMTDLAGRNIPLRGFIDSADNAKVKGYLTLLSEYLLDACEPKTTYGERTALWGLQRPPMHDDKSLTFVRGASGATFDAIAPYILPFYATNAHNQVIVSCAEDHLAARVSEATETLGGIRVEVETDKEFERSSADAWNIVEIDARESAAPETMPLVGQFASLLFPLGHIKSTLPNDEKFVAAFSASPKWLMMR